MTSATTGGALFGAFEFSQNVLVNFGTCGCQLNRALNGGAQFIVNGAGFGDLLLPIANNPALFNASSDMQGFLFDSAMACASERSTQRATIILGR
jgi:hypothetical protein